MKKLLALLLCILTLTALAACAEKTGQYIEFPNMTAVLDQNEYVLYQNIFFNGQADDYVGKTRSTEGVLTSVYDAFSQKTRYYVWGYMDATKCCDWQWEFVPEDPEKLPEIGSLVELSGTLSRDNAALDKIWFTDAELKEKKAAKDAAAADCDFDLTILNATLERVQLMNMQRMPESFQGKTLRLYGRVSGLNEIQHPYYDGVWTQKLSDTQLPAIGTMVIVTGVWEDDSIRVQSVVATPDY